MTRYEHILYGLDRVEAVGDIDAYASVGGFEISGICDVILIVERGYYLDRLDTETGHAVAVERYVDDIGRHSIELHFVNAIYVEDRAPHKLRVIFHLEVGETFGRHGIKHAVDIAEIFLHHRCLRAGRERCRTVAYLAAEQVPALLNLLVFYRRLKFDGDNRQVGIRYALHVAYIADGADGFFKRVGYLQLHLMSRCPRINRGNDGKLHLDFGILQLAHCPS